jgi:hypothetical protein
MSADTDLARELLTEQVLDATTLSEIQAARQALRAWIEAHPEYEGMGDAFEQLSLLQDIAEEQEAERAPSRTCLSVGVSSFRRR